MKLLIVSRDQNASSGIISALKDVPDLIIEQRVPDHKIPDFLNGAQTPPDAIILHVASGWTEALHSISAQPRDRRPPLIVIGSLVETTDLRLAMQAGARDMLAEPLVPSDLIAAIRRIQHERSATGSQPSSTITAFINAKGGCGATLLACNTAHAQATLTSRRVALIDLDFQFGSIPLYFDMYPKRGILQALDNVNDLDEAALGSYMARDPSGLDILGNAAEDPVPVDFDVKPDQLKKLLEIVSAQHNSVIIDLPRHIDRTTALILERAHRVVVVVQQSVAVLRDASRLMSCLRRDLAIGPERVIPVVNRYEKRVSITLNDIRRTLSLDDLAVVPNDYRTVSESIDAGRPLLVHAHSRAITKAVIELQERIDHAARPARARLFSRILSHLLPSGAS